MCAGVGECESEGETEEPVTHATWTLVFSLIGKTPGPASKALEVVAYGSLSLSGVDECWCVTLTRMP